MFRAALNRGKREIADSMSARLMNLAALAAQTIEKAMKNGDARASLTLLTGLGLLPGVLQTVGSTDPRELAIEEVERESKQSMRSVMHTYALNCKEKQRAKSRRDD